MSTFDLTPLLPLADGALTLDGGTVPGPVLVEQLARLTGGNPIVVRDAARSERGDTVTVTGRADLLGVEGMPVTVTATPGPDGGVTARFTLIDGLPGPGAWRFSRSFPDLPPFGTGAPVDKRARPADPSGAAPPEAPPVGLLDRLSLSDAAFVLTTRDGGTDAVTGASLRAGLNFAARCNPTGLLGLVGSLIDGGGALVLSGPIVVPRATATALPPPTIRGRRFPWQQPEPPPGIHLRADLGVDRRLGGALRFHEVSLRIYTPLTAAWMDANPAYTPLLAGSALLDVPSAGLSLALTALGLTSPSSLMLVGSFEGVSLGNLAGLADATGPGDLASHLPADVRGALAGLESLALEAFTLRLGPGLGVAGVDVTVGLAGLTTDVLPGFGVGDLRAHFSVADPFGSARAVAVGLGGELRFLDAPFDVALDLPEVSATAELKEATALPLGTLLDTFGLPAPADLTVNELRLEADGTGAFAVAAAMASEPAWTLDLGPTGLTVRDVRVVATRPPRSAAGRAASGSFSGVVALGDDLELGVAYQTPGAFVLRADLPDVNLMELVGALTSLPLALPGDFDLAFTDSAVLIQDAGQGLVFQLATTMEELGTAAVEVRRASGGGGWGFAAGVDLASPRLSALPGLGALAPFESFFRLDELLLVVASFDDPAFQFPAFAAFNTPALPPAGSLRLPAQGGVIAGLNAYARWTLDTSEPQQALLRSLLGLDPSLGVALQVGANPATDSRLYVSYSTTLQGHPFACTFGGQIKDGQVGLFLTGRLQVAIQEQPLLFDVTLLFVAAGAFVSGSVLGSVTFEGLTLSNLALVVGINWEGIPSLGVAATLAIDRFSSSVAVFFDSTNPARSLLAGSVTDLTLRDVVDVFAGPAVPSEVDDVLARIQLVGTNAFTVGAEVGDALDGLRLGAVAAAFAAHGVTIPATASQVLVVAGAAGRWFLTDLATMHHYLLERQADGIHVTLDPQLYVAPAPTTIGALRLPQGFFVNGALDVFGFTATATVDVAPSRGIAVDGAMDRLVVGSEALFSVTSMDGATGPAVSIATFNRPELPDPDLRRPHVLIDGNLRMLGLRRGVRLSVGAGGLSFEIAGPLVPGITYDLRGHVGGLNSLSAGGTLAVGVASLGTLDLGPLGSVTPDAGVEGALDLGFSDGVARAQVTGTFAFAGTTLTLAPLHLSADGDMLTDVLPDAVRDAVGAALRAFLTDAAQWARLVRDGVVTAARGIRGAMEQGYGLTAAGAARAFQQAGYTAEQVADLLQSDWGAARDEVGQTLRAAGYGAADAARALQTVFTLAAPTVTAALRAAGYTAAQVGDALQEALGAATADVGATLLRGAGFTADEAGRALMGAYAVAVPSATAALGAAGYAAGEVGTALRGAFGVDDAALAASLLHDARFGAEGVARGLKAGYGEAMDDAARALHGLGYGASDVGGALKAVWNAAPDAVGGALRRAGYPLDQVGTFLKNAFGLGPKALNSALDGAGYATDQIKGFFGSLGGEFGDLFDGIGGIFNR